MNDKDAALLVAIIAEIVEHGPMHATSPYPEYRECFYCGVEEAFPSENTKHDADCLWLRAKAAA